MPPCRGPRITPSNAAQQLTHEVLQCAILYKQFPRHDTSLPVAPGAQQPDTTINLQPSAAHPGEGEGEGEGISRTSKALSPETARHSSGKAAWRSKISPPKPPRGPRSSPCVRLFNQLQPGVLLIPAPRPESSVTQQHPAPQVPSPPTNPAPLEGNGRPCSTSPPHPGSIRLLRPPACGLDV